MTLFVLITLGAVLIALSSLLIPLWRHAQQNQHILLGVTLLMLVPIALVGLYVVLGEPRAIERTSEPSDQLRERLITIANDLERNPDNQDNWFALGMAYKNIESFSSAEHAFRRALYLDDSNSVIKAELAETLIFANVGATPPEADELLGQALVLDPENQKALWLTGVLAFSNQQFADAIGQWERLLAQLPSDASVRPSIERQIELARQQDRQTPTGRVIELSIDIAPSLRTELVGSETVFVIAQAVDGPPTPLAAKRLQVDQLPTTITLSDADAMIEGMTLSSFGELRLTARVSLGGDVAPMAGDLEGRVRVGPLTRASILIDNRIE